MAVIKRLLSGASSRCKSSSDAARYWAGVRCLYLVKTSEMTGSPLRNSIQAQASFPVAVNPPPA